MEKTSAVVLCVLIVVLGGLLFALIEADRAKVLAMVHASYTQAALPGASTPVWVKP